MVLAHEQAHRQRRDILTSAIATIWLCLSWFNPLMYWATSRFRFDQDLACDAVVLSASGTRRRLDAEALLKTQLSADSDWLVPIGCHLSKHPLKERIAMLKHPLPTATRRLIGAVLTCTLIVFGNYAVWTSLPELAFAQPGSQQAQAAQGQVDEIDEETGSLVEEYRAVMENVDGLLVYNTLLERQIAIQEEVLQNRERGRAKRVVAEDPENARRLLNEARAANAREEARASQLEATYEENSSLIVDGHDGADQE